MFPCGVVCVNGVSVAFCMFYSATCRGGRRVCACARELECLQEWGRQGAVAAKASPSVSLPPLAPSALTEVVTRR